MSPTQKECYVGCRVIQDPTGFARRRVDHERSLELGRCRMPRAVLEPQMPMVLCVLRPSRERHEDSYLFNVGVSSSDIIPNKTSYDALSENYNY